MEVTKQDELYIQELIRVLNDMRADTCAAAIIYLRLCARDGHTITLQKGYELGPELLKRALERI